MPYSSLQGNLHSHVRPCAYTHTQKKNLKILECITFHKGFMVYSMLQACISFVYVM